MTTQTYRPYPPVIVKKNRFGHLEMWRGLNVKVDETEADLYIQLDTDVNAIFADLPAEEREDIENGWTIITYFVSDEYFGDGGMTQ